jgi:hypothetical protein
VVRRACKGGKRELDDSALQSLAVKTANEDGYELPVEAVRVKR